MFRLRFFGKRHAKAAQQRKVALRDLTPCPDGSHLVALDEALRDQDPSVRREAVIAIERLQEAGAIGHLTKALKDPDRSVRLQTIHALGELKAKEAVAILSTPLGTGDVELKKAAAVALEKIGDHTAARTLVDMSSKDDESVVTGVREGLVQLGPDVIPALMGSLMDGQPSVRAQAARLLGSAGDLRAVPALMAAVEDPSAKVRRAALGGLGELADAQGRSALEIGLRDGDEEARVFAARGLGEIADAKSATALIGALADSARSVREAAVRALITMGQDAGEALVRALSEQDYRTREQAARALGLMKYTPAAAALEKALTDGEWSVRRYAAEALGHLGNPQAVTVLVESLKDPIDLVRECAARALDRLDSKGELRKQVARGKRTVFHEAFGTAPADEEAKSGPPQAALLMDEKEAWETLHLRAGASFGEVRKAYLEQIRMLHPDMLRGAGAEQKKEAEEDAKRLNAAYQTLRALLEK